MQVNFTTLPCYIATVPQQDLDRNSGLFVGEYYRRLLNGLDFESWIPHVTFSRAIVSSWWLVSIFRPFQMVDVRCDWQVYFEQKKKLYKKRLEIGKDNMLILDEESPSDEQFVSPVRSKKRKRRQ